MKTSHDVAAHFIADLATRPRDFSEHSYVLLDKKTSIEYCIVHGWRGFSVYDPVKLRFPLSTRWRCWRAIERWRAEVLVLRMEQTDDD